MIRQRIDEQGRLVLTLPGDPPTNADGTSREVTVTLPKGRVLDAITAHEIVTALERAARSKGQA